MKYRDLLLCGLLLSSFTAAWAESVRVEAMRLNPSAAWQRGDPAQEREDEAYLLEWPSAGEARGVALQLVLPRRATPLKTDATAFFANLRQKWAQLYGKRVEIGQAEIGGRSWLYCRRPAGAGDAVVFMLASVHAGRAYSVLAFAAPPASGLPGPVHDLLATAVFAASVSPWTAQRVVTAQPGREALAAGVRGDAEELGHDGMLTGYGVRYLTPTRRDANESASRLEWFIEGFRWRARGGRDERVPFNHQGHLEGHAGVAANTFLLRLAATSDTALEVEVGHLDLCAPGPRIDAALAQVAAGSSALLEGVWRERPAACPPFSAATPRLLRVMPGQPVMEVLSFPAGPTTLPPSGLVRLGVVYLRPRPALGDPTIGQGLLPATGLHFVYALE